jgi:hypothetical protein
MAGDSPMERASKPMLKDVRIARLLGSRASVFLPGIFVEF